ncbi:MAG TPA: Uma2 family endonuclease [Leucothrix mucor]|nr:Uma2 family endonuclease [Leucothrix mucor]
MSALAEQIENTIDVEEYLSGERVSDIKHEYVEGQVYAMAGAKLNHNRLVRNMSALLWDALKEAPCEPVSSDMLLKTTESHYRYPDVMVICDDDHSNDDYVRENPVLIIEVLSKSTRKKDKAEKREEYLSIDSLQEYVLIEQDFAEIDVQRRSNNWQSSYYFLGDEITFSAIDVTVAVEDIYLRVDNEDIQQFLEQKQAKLIEEKEVEANQQ